MAGAEYAMKLPVRAVPVFSGVLLLVAHSSFGCDDVREQPTGVITTPSVFATSSTGALTSEVASEEVPSTGIEAVDEIIGAALDGDVDTLMSYVAYERMACTKERRLGNPVFCPDGVAEGTPLDALWWFDFCEGVALRPHDVRAKFEKSLSVPLSLYAVVTLGWPNSGMIRVAFAASPDYGWWLNVRDARIVSRSGGCVTLAESELLRSSFPEVLVPPPEDR
jgi:hypothetical protein